MKKILQLYKQANEDWYSDTEKVRLCSSRLNFVFQKRFVKKKISITISDKPSKKKGEKTFTVKSINGVFPYIFRKKQYIMLYRETEIWLEDNFPHLQLKNISNLFISISE